jgi:cytochrome c peroxidase
MQHSTQGVDMFWKNAIRSQQNQKTRRSIRKWLIAMLLVTIVASGAAVFAGSNLPNPLITLDGSGFLSTYSTAGGIDLSNPFFQSLGTNGRSCSSCHQPGDAWTVTPPHIQARFYFSGGNDPIFRTNDGANCPSADVSSFQARKSAYSLLLKKGLIRVSLPVPSTADFSIQNIQDPYSCPETISSQPALYRRPLPSTNLDFLATVMWDGRETVKGQAISADLAQQSIDATLGHAQAAVPPNAQQVSQIVSFETALYTAQVYDWKAGDLTSNRATGGPKNLSAQPFYLGINDALGADPTGAPFNPVVFTPYAAWANATGKNAAIQQSIARGETLFNTLPITITGVAGLNDLPGLQTVNGTCTTCHDTPNAGNHSLSLAIKIGTTDYPAMSALDIAGLPVYTVACADGSQLQVTDLGRAIVTGKCADVGKLKGPILRGLAARAPYFHNGGAKTLLDAVDFYDQRFALNLTTQQKRDLVNFLNTL